MIHVDPRPEPADFDQKVRKRGNHWLASHAQGEWKEYWRDCLDDLYCCYDGVCAYLGLRLNRYQGITVDHFRPKSRYPELAYEWSNYRLASSLMNARKRDSVDVLDPFEVEDGWFRLHLMTGTLYPAPELPETRKAQIRQTIDRLKLNDPNLCRTRCDCLDAFAATPEMLKQMAPVVYREALRQGVL